MSIQLQVAIVTLFTFQCLQLFVQKQPYTGDHAGIQDSQFWRHIDEYLHMIKVLVFLDEDFPSMARNPGQFSAYIG